jgi:hypothetical protein
VKPVEKTEKKKYEAPEITKHERLSAVTAQVITIWIF